MKRTQAAYVLGGAVLALGLVAGCGDEEVVKVPAESPIKVDVVATPTSLDTGAKVTVNAVVTTSSSRTLRYSWMSEGGKFSSTTTDATSWLAPDDPGVYSLSVVVTDGEAVGIGSATIAVATYLPEVSPFFRGAAYCATCHAGGVGGDQYTTWSHSPHASAMAPLVAYGQGANPNCVGCHTVGTYGLNANGTANNGGYDETAVARLEGVQCENCHGPGSQHPTPDAGSVHISNEAEMCGQCHNGTHHPTYDEWHTGAHAAPIEEAALRASCAKCHNGLLGAQFLDDPEAFRNPSADLTAMTPHTCSVCHDPHGNGNPGALRDAAVTDRALPNSHLVEKAGAGRLCMSCHNSRRTDNDIRTQINNGSAHLGPHHSVQGDMIAGVNAYTKVDSTFAWSTSRHIEIQDACITCHTHPHEGDPENGIANFTGHTFRPTVEACQPCHGTIEEFDQVMAHNDYDGDGTVEGVQNEVDGLLDILKETIIAATATQEGRDALRADFEVKMGDATITTPDQRRAAYNWAFVSFDGSHGVHNATYSIQLLQRSILFLDPGGLPRQAALMIEPE
ncbi:MAG: cytochrome c3 family protein [Candidatus Eisenbacteria bacterium]